jgi:50S ribosomal subunit-associated GTPase HflX
MGWNCCSTPSCAEVIWFAELSLSATVQAAWGKPVLDRVGLIIEIFGAHAQTKEAKLQV